MRVRAVLFDWSDTLYYTVLPLSEQIVRAAGRLGRPISEAAARELVARGLRAQESDPEVIAAERDRDRSAIAHRHADSVWFRAAGLEDDELIDAIYELFVSSGMRPYPDTEAVLRELWSLGVPVAVVSNCGWDIRRNFAHHGLERYVTEFALSFEHGVVKPEPRLFEVACELLDVEPAGVLMVGDNPAIDGGAVKAGIATLILPPVRPAARRGLDMAVQLVRTAF
jgi:HAD superfamily hydrolase (TIGR01493 family)